MNKEKYKFEILKKDNYHIYYEDRDDNAGGVIVYKNLKNNEFFEQSGKIENLIDFYNSCEMGIINFWHLLPFGKNQNDKNKLILLTDIKSLHADLNEKDSSSENQAQSDTTTPVILTSGVCEDTFSRPNREEIEKVARPSSEESQIDTFKLESEMQAATAIVEANIAEFHAEQQEIKEKEREEREALIAEASRLTGRVEAFNFTSQVATVATLVNLQKIKESGIYKELPNIKTWEEYCNIIGFSRRKVDEDLQNLNTFGENFLATGRQLGLGYRELRSLSKQVKSGSLEIKDESVVIDGEVIPLDDKDELRDALDTLLKSKYKEIEEKDKRIKDQSESIEIKNNEIARLQESNKNFFNDKQKAEKELADLKGVGTIHGITIEENADFQKIADIEREVEVLYNRLKVISGYDLSDFNKKKLGAVVIKAMNLLHDFHQELCALGVTDYYGEAFMPDEVIEADGRLETPADYLRNNK